MLNLTWNYCIYQEIFKLKTLSLYMKGYIFSYIYIWKGNIADIVKLHATFESSNIPLGWKIIVIIVIIILWSTPNSCYSYLISTLEAVHKWPVLNFSMFKIWAIQAFWVMKFINDNNLEGPVTKGSHSSRNNPVITDCSALLLVQLVIRIITIKDEKKTPDKFDKIVF